MIKSAEHLESYDSLEMQAKQEARTHKDKPIKEQDVSYDAEKMIVEQTSKYVMC